MTTPGSGGAFDYTNDTVSARLSVEVPSDALANLHQLNAQTHELRVNMEAAVRAQGNFVEYLRQLPEALTRSGQAAEQFFNHSGSQLMGALGPGAVTGTGPPMRPGGMGRNDAVRPNHAGQPGSGDGRLQQQIDELRQNDLRQYANLMAQQQGDGRTVRRHDDTQLEPPRRNGGGGGGGTGPGGPPSPPSSPGGGGSGPGRDPNNRRSSQEEADWTDRLQQYQSRGMGWLNNVLNETQAGGRGTGVDLMSSGIRGAAGMTRNFQQNIAAQQQAAEAAARAEAEQQGMDEAGTAAHVASATSRFGAMSGASGAALKGLGVAGAAVGVGMGVQKAGEWYQGMVAQGATRGGGASEGMQFEMGVRTMAMNPFLSLEQSRKIMQSAMSEGYTGKEFDTVTDFMASNLKKMNMDVQESVKILKTNVNLGGQSIAGAQRDVQTVSNLAQDPNVRMTSGQLRQQYAAQTQTVVGGAGGAGGPEASAFTQLTSQFGATDPNAKGWLGSALVGSASNPMMAATIAPEYSGAPQGALASVLDDAGGDETALRRITSKIVETAQRHIPSMANEDTAVGAIQAFNADLIAMGLPLDAEGTQAKIIMDMIVNGTFQKEVDRVIAARKKSSTGGEVKEKKKKGGIMGFLTGESGGGILSGGFLRQAVGGIPDAGKMVFGGAVSLATGGEYGAGISDQGADALKGRGNKLNADSMQFSNERLNELVTTYGKDIKVKGADGKEMGILDASKNEQLMKDVVSGKAQIKIPGGEYGSMENLSAMEDAASTQVGSGGGVFELSEDAKRLLVLIPSSTLPQNSISANSAQDNARRNEPPAGQPYDTGGG